MLLNQNKENTSRYTAGIEIKKKQEYTLMGTFLRTRGLRIYSYNPQSGEIKEVEPVCTGKLYMEFRDGKPVAVDRDGMKAFVDSRLIFFESLNRQNAEKRVNKFKSGQIELFNLRPAGGGIQL